MREILFKAKAENNGEWVKGNLSVIHFSICNKEDERYGICDRYFMSSFEISDNAMFGYDDVEVVPETVCQFTGLTDKNGNKIFEGDICRFYNGDGETSLYDVVWNKAECCFAVKYLKANHIQDYLDDWFAEHCEVIGNIFDNPELLEEGTE